MTKKVAMIGVGKLGEPCATVMSQHYDVVGYDVEDRTPAFPMKPTIQEAVQGRDFIFIAAPTPHDPVYGGETPTSHLMPKDFDYSTTVSILEEVNKHVNKEQLVILISTVLPGTVRSTLHKYITNARFIYNPYLIAMGTVAWDFINPEMVIIGTEDGNITGDAKELIDFYKPMMENDPRYEVGTWDEAESIKIFYNCYSEDTEVLTDRGWKLFSEAEDNDKVWSLNPDTMTPEWVIPDKWVSREWNSEMIHFHSSKDDILVTPGHNMFIGKQTTYHKPQNGKSWGYSWTLMPAEEAIKRSGFVFQRSTRWHNDSPEFTEVAGVDIPTDLYVQLMAWYLSEGCTSHGRIILSQDRNVNPDKHEMIYKMMLRVMDYYPGKNILCEGESGISLLWPEFANELVSYGKSFDKYVPDNIKSLGKDMIRLFLDIYNLADGSALHTKRFDGTRSTSDRAYKYYATSSDKMASDLGELIIKVGRFPSYRKTRSDISNKDCHLVYELLGKTSNYQRSSTAGLKYSKIDYSGKVYCAMLPKNHVFLTRRNGKCTWQGNTFISTKLALVNMIQDVAEKNGNINVDVVTKALAKSTHRITGPAYMTAGMGDAGACHPRDNIALRYLAQRLDLDYDLFDAIMVAREVQTKNLAKKCLAYGNKVTIVGKAYKPGVPYTNGSCSLLLGHYLEELGAEVNYYDEHTLDLDLKTDWTEVYCIGYWDDYVEAIDFPLSATIIDPWRKFEKHDHAGCVVHYGNTRLD